MTLEAAQLAAANNLWGAILPELLLAGVALALLALEIVLPRRHHAIIPDLAAAGILGVLVGLGLNWHSGMLGAETFGGLLYHSTSGQLLRGFFLLAAFLTCVLARITLARQRMPRVEFYHLLLVVTAAMMLLAQANHLLLLFVALETLTIGLYVLVSYHRTSPASLEAGLKYLLLGALSSGLLLFGITLLYGAASNPGLAAHASRPFHYAELAAFLAANPHQFLPSLGIVLVLAGVAFKIGAFPFQIWVPDVYQGAPTPVTAFLAVASKAAGFAVLLGLCGPGGAFSAYAWLTLPVLSAMAVASLIFGNLAALTQHNVKRLLGLSGVSHAGFLLLGVVAAASTPLALGALYFYLFAYLLGAFAVCGVMAHLAGEDDADQDLEHYAGLGRENPFLAGVLTVGLGSLAGIPPLAGFMGKFFILLAAYQSGARVLLAVALGAVVLSIYYYFGWIKAAYFDAWTPPATDASGVPARPARTPVGPLARVTLGALALASLVIGFYPGPLGQWLAMR